MLDYNDCPSDHGYFHESELPDYDHLKDHVIGILESLYKTGSVKQLESSLEEVCDQLEIPFEPQQPLLERKELRNYAMWHLGYQRCMLDRSL